MFKFVNMTRDHLADVLRWRTQEDVTRCLFTDLDQPSLEKQTAWFDEVQEDPSRHYWVISQGPRPIGALFVTNFDERHFRAQYGFYIGPPDMRRWGAFIPPLFYNHAFAPNGLGLRKLWFEVFVWNEPVLALHFAQGCQQIGIARDHVSKHGRWHDVVLMELTSTDWAKMSRWHSAKTEFGAWIR